MPVPPRRLKDRRADRVIVRVDQEALWAKHRAPAGEVTEPVITPPIVPPSATDDVVWTYDHGIAKWKGYDLQTGQEFDSGVTRYVTVGMGSLSGSAVRWDGVDDKVCFFAGSVEITVGTLAGTSESLAYGTVDPNTGVVAAYDLGNTVDSSTTGRTDLSNVTGELSITQSGGAIATSNIRRHWPMTGVTTENESSIGAASPSIPLVARNVLSLPFIAPGSVSGVDGSVASSLTGRYNSYAYTETEVHPRYSVGLRFQFGGVAWTPGNSVSLVAVPGASKAGALQSGMYSGSTTEFLDITPSNILSPNSPNVVARQWHSAIVTIDTVGSIAEVYVDGEYKGGGSWNTHNMQTAGEWWFGHHGANSGESIAYDDLIVWGEIVGTAVAQEFDSINLTTDLPSLAAGATASPIPVVDYGNGRSVTVFSGSNSGDATIGELTSPMFAQDRWTARWDQQVANDDGTLTALETVLSIGSTVVDVVNVNGTSGYSVNVTVGAGTLSGAVASGAWTQMALTSNVGSSALIIDGSVVDTGPAVSLAAPMVIAGGGHVGTRAYDELFVWSRELPVSELSSVNAEVTLLDSQVGSVHDTSAYPFNKIVSVVGTNSAIGEEITYTGANKAVWNQRTLTNVADTGFIQIDVKELRGVFIAADQTMYQLYIDDDGAGHIARVRNGNGLAGGADGNLENDYTFSSNYQVVQAAYQDSSLYAIRKIANGASVLGVTATDDSTFYALGTIDVSGNWTEDLYVIPVRGEPVGLVYEPTNERFYVLLDKTIYEMDFVRDFFIARVDLNGAKKWSGLDILDIIVVAPEPDPEPDPEPTGSTLWTFDRGLDYWRAFDQDDNGDEVVASRFDLPGLRDNMPFGTGEMLCYNPVNSYLTYLIAVNTLSVEGGWVVRQANTSCVQVFESASADATQDSRTVEGFTSLFGGGSDATIWATYQFSGGAIASHAIAILSDGNGSAVASDGGLEQAIEFLMSHDAVENATVVHAACWNNAADTLYVIRDAQPWEYLPEDGLVHFWPIDDSESNFTSGTPSWNQLDVIGGNHMVIDRGTGSPVDGATYLGYTGSDGAVGGAMRVSQEDAYIYTSSAVEQTADYTWISFWLNPAERPALTGGENEVCLWGNVYLEYFDNDVDPPYFKLSWNLVEVGTYEHEDGLGGGSGWESFVIYLDAVNDTLTLYIGTTAVITGSITMTATDDVIQFFGDTQSEVGVYYLDRVGFWERATPITSDDLFKLANIPSYPTLGGTTVPKILSECDISGAIARCGSPIAALWSSEGLGYFVPDGGITGFCQRSDQFYLAHGSGEYIDALDIATGEMTAVKHLSDGNTNYGLAMLTGLEPDLNVTCDDLWLATSLDVGIILHLAFDSLSGSHYLDSVGGANLQIEGSESNAAAKNGNGLARSTTKTTPSLVADTNFLNLNGFTLCFWFKISADLDLNKSIVFLQWGAGTPQTQSGDGFTVIIRNSGTGNQHIYGDLTTAHTAGTAFTGGAISSGVWHHFAMTYTTSTYETDVPGDNDAPAPGSDILTTYIDGVQYDSTGHDSQLWGTGAKPLQVFPYINTNGVVGTIDELTVWNRKLWPSDIARMATTPVFRSS